MIDPPRTVVELRPAAQLDVCGLDRERTRAAVDSWHRVFRERLAASGLTVVGALPIQINMRAAPPPHRGLGSGTQLALSLAAGLSHWFLPDQPLSEEDALRFGRGRRSAVGTHGFFHGGLIVDGGQGPERALGRLAQCVTLPTAWRVLLVIPAQSEGPSGAREESLFRELPPTPPGLAKRLLGQLHQELIPAAERGDFERFSRAVFEYGYTAGLQFASVQAGPYNGPLVQRIVDTVRAAGCPGVGQSSWGPAVFCLLPDPQAAEQLRSQLAEQLCDLEPTLQVTQASRTGHQVSERLGD